MKTRIVTLMLSEEDYNLILPYIDRIPLLVRTINKMIEFRDRLYKGIGGHKTKGLEGIS